MINSPLEDIEAAKRQAEFEKQHALEKQRSVSQWADFLRKMLEYFLDITNNN